MQMKLTVFMATFVFACVLGFGPRALPQDAPKEHTMTGCLQKGATDGTYELMNTGKGPMVVEISESAVNLAPHVGHKIDITGTAVPGAKVHTMKITAIKMISTTCP
jgi:hypothetical protein